MFHRMMNYGNIDARPTVVLTRELIVELMPKFRRHDDLIVVQEKAWREFKQSLPLPVAQYENSPFSVDEDELASLVCQSVQKPICRRLAIDRGVKNDDYRTPDVVLLIGEDGVVCHRDNHILYQFDVTKCMFSFGNVREKMRMAELDCSDEVVVDLFAGIGYFSLPLLVHAKAKHLYACEWNPDAVDALKKNLELNKVEPSRYTVIEGDNRSNRPTDIAQRVILGILPSCSNWIRTAFECIDKKTGAILHCHDLVEVPAAQKTSANNSANSSMNNSKQQHTNSVGGSLSNSSSINNSTTDNQQQQPPNSNNNSASLENSDSPKQLTASTAAPTLTTTTIAISTTATATSTTTTAAASTATTTTTPTTTPSSTTGSSSSPSSNNDPQQLNNQSSSLSSSSGSYQSTKDTLSSGSDEKFGSSESDKDTSGSAVLLEKPVDTSFSSRSTGSGGVLITRKSANESSLSLSPMTSVYLANPHGDSFSTRDIISSNNSETLGIYDNRGIALIARLQEDLDLYDMSARLIHVQPVKSYAPHVDHVVIDIKIEPNTSRRSSTSLAR